MKFSRRSLNFHYSLDTDYVTRRAEEENNGKFIVINFFGKFTRTGNNLFSQTF